MRALNWRQQLLDLSNRLRVLAGAPPAGYESLAELNRRTMAERQARAAPPPSPPLDLSNQFHLPAEPTHQTMPESNTPSKLLAELRNPGSVRRAYILKEILDRPRALRRRV
ncbi:MAG: hypothetical protein AAF458_09610 [Pseudomonadota bacterium]